MKKFVKKRKVISMIIALMLVVYCVPSMAFAEEIIDTEASIIDSGRCGQAANWTFNSDGVLTITGKGDMLTYESNNTPWNSYKKEIKEVIIEKNISSIGSYSFYYCYNLTKVTLPTSLVCIDNYAFAGCSSLLEVTLPSMLTSIEMSAFEGCKSLSDITFPQSLDDIGMYAFKDCVGLKSVVLPSSMDHWGNSSIFRNCVLEEFTFPNQSEWLGHPFSGSYVKKIIVPYKLSNVSSSAFTGATIESIVFYNKKTPISKLELALDGIIYGFEGSTAEKFAIQKGYTFVSLDDIHEHNWKLNGIIYPRCTFEGNTKYVCEQCGDIITEKLPATGHSYIGVVTAPTCTEDGYTTYTCKNDTRHTYIGDYVDATGHAYGDVEYTWNEDFSSVTAKRVCANDAVHIEKETIKSIYEETPATCTKAGEGKHIAVFENKAFETQIKAVEIPAQNHIYEAVVTAPTCTEKGYTTYICECGDTYTADEVAALDHSYDDGVITTEPTCEKDGVKTFTCGTCGNTYTEKVAAVGHDWEEDCTIDKEASCTEEGSKSIHCAKCDATKDATIIEKLAHSFGEWEETTEPTCTEPGEETRKCACGEKETRAVETTDHDYEAVVTAPTCTEKGYTTYTCKNDAKHTYVADYVDAAGHKMAFHEAESATCEEAGNIAYYTCNVCEGYFLDEKGEEATTADKVVVAATGHKYGAYKTTTKAKFGKDGVQTATCAACSAKGTKPIAAPKTIQLSYTSYTYNGKIKKPTVKAVYDSNGNKISSANYKVSYASGCKNVGKYKVTATFNKNSADYEGKIDTTFKINPKSTTISKVTAAKKGFTVKWKKQTGKMAKTRITGYQYRYSTSSKMTNAVTKTVKGYGKTSAKKTGLKAKKTYYVQVRTYKTVNGVKYYSPWSKYKKVKTK